MNGAWQEWRYGIRRLARHRRLAMGAILTVALGIGPNVLIFSVLRATIFHELPYHGSDDLAFISNVTPTTPRAGVGAGQVEQWIGQGDLFVTLAPTNPVGSMTLTGVPDPETLRVTAVSPELSKVLGVYPVAGRGLSRYKSKLDEVLISEELWERQFRRDPTLVGKQILLSDHPYTVVGVMPGAFDFLRLIFPRQRRVDVWLSLSFTPQELSATWGGTLWVVARLQPGISHRVASERLTSLMLPQSHLPQNVRNIGINVENLHNAIYGDIRPALLLLAGAAGCVLLLACFNVMNLLLTRSEKDRIDTAISVALGATRWQIARQTLIEMALIALGGTAVALLLASWGVRLLPLVLPADYPYVAQASIDRSVLLITILTAASTIVFSGVLPALAATAGPVVSHLSGAGMTSSIRRRRFRNALVVLEIAIAIALAIASGLILRGFYRRISVPRGFDSNQVLLVGISLPESRYAQDHQVALFQDNLLRRLNSTPGIGAAAAASGIPGIYPANGTDFGESMASKTASSVRAEAYMDYVSGDYFRALQIPLLQGRTFGSSDHLRSQPVAIIDTTAAHLLGPGAAVGKEIFLDNPQMRCEVIGVVGHVHLFGFPNSIEARIYMPFSQAPLSTFALVLRASLPPPDVAASVRSAVSRIDPNLPIGRIVPLSRRIADQTSSHRFHLVMVGSMGLLALALASSGVFSVTAYALSQRRRELAVRTSLGATPAVLARMILWDGAKQLALGLFIGLFVTAALGRLMVTVFRDVRLNDPLVVSAALLVVASAVLCAILIPTLNIMRIDAVTELRAP